MLCLLLKRFRNRLFAAFIAFDTKSERLYNGHTPMRGKHKGAYTMGMIRGLTSRIVVVLVAMALMTSQSFASSDLSKVSNPGTLPEHVEILSESEMDQITGEVHPIVAGAIAGAVGSAFYYATSPGEKSFGGFAEAVGKGTLTGALTGTATTIALVATGAQVAVSAAATAWSAWGSGNVGALSGAMDHVW